LRSCKRIQTIFDVTLTFARWISVAGKKYSLYRRFHHRVGECMYWRAAASRAETRESRSFVRNEQCVVVSGDFLTLAKDYTHGTSSP
jgi:hypothetical protein